MAKAEAKTRPTASSVQQHLAAIDDPVRRQDGQALADLMQRVTGQPALLWGGSIVGFGSYHYRYASGHEGDSCQVGFAARKNDLTVYLVAGFDGQPELLARLGKHKMGKACLYIKRLADVDLQVLEALVAGSVAEVRRRYPGSPA
jgi:hypothetical protein